MQLLERTIRTLEHLASIYEKRDAFAAGRLHREMAEQLKDVREHMIGA